MVNMEAIRDFLQEAYSEGVIDACETVELFEIAESANEKNEESTEDKKDIRELISLHKKEAAISIAIATAAVIFLGSYIKKEVKIRREVKDKILFEKVFKDNEKNIKDLLRKQSNMNKILHTENVDPNDFMKAIEEIDDLSKKIIENCLKIMPKKDVKEFCDRMISRYSDQARKMQTMRKNGKYTSLKRFIDNYYRSGAFEYIKDLLKSY